MISEKDQNHEIKGTTFSPLKMTKGDEELESWLLRLLSPKINFQFFEITVDGVPVVILEINRASHKPVQFEGQEYLRIGSYKKKLKDFPEKERELWRIFDKKPFEELIAKKDLSEEDVLKNLDYPSYFDLLDINLPDNRNGILNHLESEDMIKRNQGGTWDITNMGAILFAKELHAFKHLARKAVRVIIYNGKNRLSTFREQGGQKGYASGFGGLIEYITNMLPANEIIGKAIRKDIPMFPDVAIRELVANALIHQDFFIHGTGTKVEIFSDRMEIINPGTPLIKIDRLLGSPPKSRNERLASFLRRVGVCEERGSGIEKVVFQTELFQLPAPEFKVLDDHTRVTLFAHKSFAKMDRDDRLRACYLHACLKYVQREYMTNTSLRKRFDISNENYSMVSRLIRDSIEEKLVKQSDPDNLSRKHAKYIPFWA